MVAEVTIENQVAHTEPFLEEVAHSLGLSLNTQEFGAESDLSFVLVLAALGTSPGSGRGFLFGALFALLLALLGLLLLLLRTQHLLVGKRIGLPLANMDERDREAGNRRNGFVPKRREEAI